MEQRKSDKMERSSSFARSFFQAGAGNNNADNPYGYGNAAEGSSTGAGGVAGGGGGGDMFAGQTMGTPRAQRRRSSRRRSRSGYGGNSDASMMHSAAAAAAAAMVGLDDKEPKNMPAGLMSPGGGGDHMGMHMGGRSAGPLASAKISLIAPGGPGMIGGQGAAIPQPRQQQRQPSWYQEALLQGGDAEGLQEFLGEASNANDHTVDDDEVLEQYRIMAHVEANKQVRDNTGFNLAEYEQRRQMHPDNSSRGDYAKKPKPILPEPRKIAPSGGAVGGIGGMQAEEPPLPPPRVNRRFVEQRALRVPELCPGTVLRGSDVPPRGEVAIRCLGCRIQLLVKLMSTLASCPECSTVSPATTTLR